MPFRLKSSMLALGASALFLWSASAHALVINISNSHFVQAATSVSDGDFRLVRAADDVRGEAAVTSSGLGGLLGNQGAVSTASATQSVLYDAQAGAFGSLQSSIDLGVGVTGFAESIFFVPFEILSASSFSLSVLRDVTGNATSILSAILELDPVGAPNTTIFDLDLLNPTTIISGLLAPGTYTLRIEAESGRDDTGTSGSSRLDFDFRFEDVSGGNTVPEPTSLALVAAAMGLMARLIRRPLRMRASGMASSVALAC